MGRWRRIGMISRSFSPKRQRAAQFRPRQEAVLASTAECVNLVFRSRASHPVAGKCQDRYPSPSLRSDLSRVGPVLLTGSGKRRRSKGFDVCSPFSYSREGAINIGGNAGCILSRLPQLWPWSPFWADASKTMRSAVSPAQLAEPRSPERPAETRRPAPLSAARRACSAVISTWQAAKTASRPAGARPGTARKMNSRNGHRGHASRWPFHVLRHSDRPERGIPCSRRS